MPGTVPAHGDDQPWSDQQPDPLSGALLRLAGEVGRIGGWTLDARTGELTWSDELLALLDHPTGHDRPVDALEVCVPEDRDRLAAAVTACITRGQRLDLQVGVTTRSGRRRIRLVGDPERDDAGRTRRIVGVAQDVSDRLRMEQQLIHAQRLQTVGTLAGGFAHDLRNVLTPVLMSLALLRHGESDPLRLDVLETVERNTRRGTDIVSQLLSFARGVDGSRTEVPIEALLHDLTRFVQQTFPPSYDLRCVATRHAWAVRGDPTQIHQVLVNLLINARDAMPEGGPIEVRADDITIGDDLDRTGVQLPPGTYVRLQVIDQGSGMPPSVSERIFDPFFTTKRSGVGTGLGLSTAHAIVRNHGGDIAVTSRPGAGTTFTIHLPAVPRTVEATVAAQQEPAVSAAGEVVLVVDDEPLVRSLTRRTLARAGYEVIEAEDGAGALAAFADAAERIDLVVTDLLMPNMGGRELASRLRERRPDLPVVISSGSSRASGGDLTDRTSWLAKPFTADELLRQVRAALGPRTSTDATAAEPDGTISP